MEETWLEALSGELLKPYTLDLCCFVAHERLHIKVPIYPPPHLVFHAPNRAAARIGRTPSSSRTEASSSPTHRRPAQCIEMSSYVVYKGKVPGVYDD